MVQCFSQWTEQISVHNKNLSIKNPTQRGGHKRVIPTTQEEEAWGFQIIVESWVHVIIENLSPKRRKKERKEEKERKMKERKE